MRLLIAHGADIDASIDCSTPLSVAADHHHPDTVALLLHLGASLEAEYGGEGTALFEVAGQGDLPMVKLLVAKGANVNHGSHYESILQAAADHPEIVRFLLIHGAKVNEAGKGDLTPLTEAAHFGNAESVQILLSHGADGNHLSEGEGTALTIAAREGHTDVVKVLLRWGVDVNLHAVAPYTDEPFETALQAAQGNHHTGIVRLLKQAGARE